jgi:ABC-type Na+ efflux pump permease subunit
MFDNLREDAASSPFYEEEESAKFQPAAATKSFFATPGPSRRILGMTGLQRFVIAFMFFIAVCLVGGMALLVTGKIMF